MKYGCHIWICLFGVLRRFQHCTGHITTGSWKGRGNQYIEFTRVVYCKLPTNGKQLPAFPLKAMTGSNPVCTVTYGGTTGKGERKVRDRHLLQRLGFHLGSNFYTTEVEQQLALKNWWREHNHEITVDIYTHHPRICRLDVTCIKEVEDILRVDPNREMVRHYFVEKKEKQLKMNLEMTLDPRTTL